MKCTKPSSSTFLTCLAGCEMWMIVVKKPPIMLPTSPPAWRCSCSKQVPVTNTTSTVRMFCSTRTTGVCLVLRCRTVIPSRMSSNYWTSTKSNTSSKKWYKTCSNAKPSIVTATVGTGFGSRSMVAAWGVTTINATSNACIKPQKPARSDTSILSSKHAWSPRLGSASPSPANGLKTLKGVNMTNRTVSARPSCAWQPS